ncbi:MAG: xanthine dehydrogenase family protein subunit M [Nitrospinae bacterium]|nr:xanthine dehydrogenase family protein subunit M [Nitrospinota bacterium]
MKPPPFEYYRATTVEEAIARLSQYGPDAKVLAGGQSLVPMLKFRLARPSVLVDLNWVRDLAYVREANGSVAFGAMARLAGLESDQARSLCPILAEAAPHIGHPAIRHRGTVCGSLAHADPAAELPMLALALDAKLVATGPNGARVIPARDFFIAILTTSLGPSEILTEAQFPVLRPESGWGFSELSRRPGDFALVAAAATLDVGAAGTITQARIAIGAVADRAIRCPEAEATLLGQMGGRASFEAAAVLASAPLEPPSDVHASSGYRRHLARVLVERVLTQAWQRVRSTRAAPASS